MKKICSLVICLMILFIGTKVQAASFGTKITSNVSTVRLGQEVIVTISLEDIDFGSNGVKAFQATLEYDEAIFEVVNKDSISGKNDWQVSTYNAKKIIIERGLGTSVGMKDDGPICSISFKVKSGISASTATIAINNISAANESDLEEDTRKSVTIAIDRGNTNNNNTTTNTNTSTNTNTNTSTNTNTVSNSEEDLPYTGIEDTLFYVLVIAIIWVIGSVFLYKKYKGMKI